MMRNNDTRSSSLRTSDLPLVVTLLTLGFSFEHIDVTNPSRVIFEFSDQKGLQEATDAFWAGKITVEPKIFWNLQRELKARIRNAVEVKNG